MPVPRWALAPGARWAVLLPGTLLLLFGLVRAEGLSGQVSLTDGFMHEMEMEASSLARGTIGIQNTTSVPQRVRITATDLFYGPEGLQYQAAGTLERSNAGWIELDAEELVLPAGESVSLGYSVQAPASGAAGTYWSGLFVQGTPEPLGGETGGAPGGTAVRTVLRYLVQVATHLGGDGQRAVDILDPQLDDAGVLRVQLANIGLRGVRPAVRLEAYDEAAMRVGEWYEPPRGTLLYPGDVAWREFHLTGLAPGRYSLLLLADVGADVVHAARLSVER